MAAPSEDDIRSHPAIARLVDQKLQFLRLLRALDRVGIDPQEVAGIRKPLVRIAQLDSLFDSSLEFCEREPAAISGLESTLRELVASAEAARGDVLDALSSKDQEALVCASREVAVNEFEVWNEVAALRRTAAEEPDEDVEGVDELDGLLDAEALADEIWGEGGTGGFEVHADERVRRHERKPMPTPDAPLREFFDRLPRNWRRVMAQFHDIPVQGRPALAQRLADRVSDPAWLRTFIGERLGRSERELLWQFATTTAIPIDIHDDLHADRAGFELGGLLEVHWDWEEGLPPATGGKLRAAGLVHVGSDRGERIAAVPPVLKELVLNAIREADAELADHIDSVERAARAREEIESSSTTPELARWQELDNEVTAQVMRQISDPIRELEAPFRALTGSTDLEFTSENELYQAFEFAVYVWRSKRGGPTLADQWAPSLRWSCDDARALFDRIRAAPPVVYRIAATDERETVKLERVFPAGSAENITDRGLAMSCRPGWLIAARNYDAGPYRRMRLLGGPVASGREKRFLRALRRERSAFQGPGGEEGDVLFLREQPEVMLRLVTQYGSS